MKFCVKCGNSLEDNANECELCGEMQPYTPPSKQENDDEHTSVNTYPYEPENCNQCESENNYSQQYTTYQQPADSTPNYYNQQPYNTGTYKRSNSACVTGFVLGIISIFPLGINLITGIIGLIFSIIGVKNFNPDTESGKGFGITGIIMNSLALVCMLFIILIFVVFICIAADSGSMYY